MILIECGKKELLINDRGDLLIGGELAELTDTRGFHHTGTTSSIFGGKIDFWKYGAIELRKHTDVAGRVTWDCPDGTLCTLKDIDAVRKQLKRSAVKA